MLNMALLCGINAKHPIEQNCGKIEKFGEFGIPKKQIMLIKVLVVVGCCWNDIKLKRAR